MGFSRNSRLRVERRDALALEIQAVLEEDLAGGAKLMQSKYRPEAVRSQTLDGYCAAAANAYFSSAAARSAVLSLGS